MLAIKLILLILAGEIATEESKLDHMHSFNLDVVLKGLQNINSTSPCGIHLKEYLHGLDSGKIWAHKMRDSSAHTLHGVFNGNNKFLGHFDECLSSKHSENLFRGQHCVLNLDFFDERKSLIFQDQRNIENHMKIHSPTETSSQYFTTLFAICVPSTCSSREIEEVLREWFNKKIEKVNHVLIRLDQSDCYTQEGISNKENNWLIVYCFIGICFISLCSTIYDVVQRFYYNFDRPHKLLVSCSVYTNSSHIINDIPEDSILTIVNGLRAIYTFLTLYGHTYLYFWFGPAENLIDFQEFIDKYGFVDLNHATDTFFFIGGFVLAYMFSRRLINEGYYDFPLSLIERYIRISVTLVFVRLFCGWLFLNLATGPLWNYFNKTEFEACREGWTSTLLYSWNYVNPLQWCMRQGWYLNVDMQLFWLSPLILIPALYYPTWAAKFYFPTLISIATFISFAVNYSYGFRPHMKHLYPDRWAPEYIATHARATPWLIGVFFGYIFYSIHEGKSKINLSKVAKSLGWITSLLCLFMATFGSIFLGDDKYVSRFQGALYISLSKVLTSLALAWIIFAARNGYGEPISAMLTSRLLQFFAKISYGVYLVQFQILSYIIGIKRTNYTYGLWEMVKCFPTVLLLIIIIAFITTVLIEVPSCNIRRYFLRNVKLWPIYKPTEKKLKEKQEKAE